MPTKTIEIQQTEAYINQLLALIGDGTELILTQSDTPIAKLIPIQAGLPGPRTAGLHTGRIQMREDFDMPLPEDFWLGQAHRGG